jgi:hypothetical protein
MGPSQIKNLYSVCFLPLSKLAWAPLDRDGSYGSGRVSERSDDLVVSIRRGSPNLLTTWTETPQSAG